jgi:hypothetical protein
VYPPPPPGAKRAIFARRSTDSGATCETHLFISRIVLTFRFCSPRANEMAPRCSGGAVQHVAGNASAAGERTDPGPMWHAASNTLVLHVGGAAFDAKGQSKETWQLTSTDKGLTFSEPRSLSAELGVAAGFRPGPGGGLALRDGRLMVAGYGELGQPWPYRESIDGVVGVWFSDDGAQSWRLADVACASAAKCNTSAVSPNCHSISPVIY